MEIINKAVNVNLHRRHDHCGHHQQEQRVIQTGCALANRLVQNQKPVTEHGKNKRENIIWSLKSRSIAKSTQSKAKSKSGKKHLPPPILTTLY